ncbi:MAG: hypothetical protein QXD43_02930 [Candidatus Aenigmatarchaeota archaeon]
MSFKINISLPKNTFSKRNSKYSFNEMENKRKIETALRKLKKLRWRYKNSIALILVLLLTFLTVRTKIFKNFIQSLGKFGYVGSLIAGLLYAYSFTIAFSLSVFYFLGKFLDHFIVALFGALGAAVGDYLLFRFVKQNLSEEIRFLIQDIKSVYLKTSFFFKIFPFSNLILSENFENIVRKVYASRAFKILTNLIGYVIIASPLPDEIGVTLLGIVKHRKEEFIFLTFFLNFIGILSFLILSQNF